MDLNFAALVEQSRQLTAHFDPSREYFIQRNVEQIDETSRRLALKTARVAESEGAKNKGRYLLATKGFDAEKLAQNLNAINLKTTFEPLEPLSETDLEGYLRHEHDMIILTAIQEAKKETLDKFQDSFAHFMDADWEKSKHELLEALGQRSTGPSGIWTGDARRPAQSQGVPPSPYMPQSWTETGGQGQKGKGRSVMSDKMLKYAAVVHQLNEYKINRKPYAPISAFVSAAARVEDSDTRKEEVKDCWKLVMKTLHEEDAIDGVFQREALPEGAYEERYRNNAPELRPYFIRGTKRFLEEQYSHFMGYFIKTHPKESNLGGEHGLENKVRAFWCGQYGSDPKRWPAGLEDIVDKLPIWPQIYYAIRAGDLRTAAKIADKARHILYEFSALLQEYTENRGLLDAGRVNECRRIIRNSRDPFKKAVYNIIARADGGSSMPALVFSTIQDWLWLKLSLLGDAVEGLERGMESDGYTLEQLQKQILEYGEAHFSNKGKNPLLFFLVLLATQQFERAIQYLANTEQYYVEAIHFAIALNHYGVLRQPSQTRDGVEEQFFFQDDKGKDYINYVRLLRAYVANFAVSDPLEGVHYYYTIRDKTTQYRCITHLVLQTREFDLLLGTVQPDGRRKEGCIYKFISDEEEVRQIVDLAALDSEKTGNHEDAVKLYDLAGNCTKVLGIINSRLSQVLTLTGPERDRTVALANTLYQRYSKQQMEMYPVSEEVVETFKAMKALTSFFDFYRAGRYNEALRQIENVGIIPFDMSQMQEGVERFKYLSEAIRRNFADILLAAMTTLYKLYSSLKNAETPTPQIFAAGGREQEMHTLRAKARALVTYAGRIPYRMPDMSRLIRYEVLMG